MTTRSGKFALLIALVVTSSTNVSIAQTRLGKPRLFSVASIISKSSPPNAEKLHREVANSDEGVLENETDQARHANRRVEMAMRARQALWHAQSPDQRTTIPPQFDHDSRGIVRASTEYESQADISARSYVSEPSQGSWTTEVPYPSNDLVSPESWTPGHPKARGADQHQGVLDSWQVQPATESCFEEAGDGMLLAYDSPTTISIFSGVHAYTNPVNEGLGGSFGLHEGLNIGTPLPIFVGSGWGWQIGLRATQSNISGTGRSRLERHQTFFTTGVFRRVDCGWQGGLVVDMLDDEWLDDIRLTQLRGELGWRFASHSEWGYWFAGSGASDLATQTLSNPIRFTVSDVQGIYCRQALWNYPDSSVRLLVGFSNDADGLVAAESMIPLTPRTSLASSFSYLVPNEATGFGGAENEIWNLSLTLEFALGGANCRSPYAPLFSVADNGVFFVDAD